MVIPNDDEQDYTQLSIQLANSRSGETTDKKENSHVMQKNTQSSNGMSLFSLFQDSNTYTEQAAQESSRKSMTPKKE
jgi:hypothetical protein